MDQDPLAIHHQHIRKRIYKNLEKYPHDDKFKSIMDIMVYFASIFGNVMTLPQLWIVWIDKNTSGISVISWSAYVLTALIWLTYGIMHKEKPIIFANIFSVLMNLMVVIGVIIYH